MTWLRLSERIDQDFRELIKTHALMEKASEFALKDDEKHMSGPKEET